MVSRTRSSPGDIAAVLNARQRAYLLAAYAEDQSLERCRSGFGGPPAREWRWMVYGPVGHRDLGSGPLRRELMKKNLVDRGAGSTWASLAERGLVETRHAFTGFLDPRSMREIQSLLVQMTMRGRKVARVLRGEPATKPQQVKDLSLSALRLIAYGQAHPGESFEIGDPWEFSPNHKILFAIANGLIRRGLLDGAPYSLRITDAGRAFDVTVETNWKPMKERRAFQ